MSDDEERVDLDEVSGDIVRSLAAAMDENSRLMKICRSKANQMFDLANRLDDLAEEYRRIASQHVIAAHEHASMLADSIKAEYDITESDGKEPGDEPDIGDEESLSE